MNVIACGGSFVQQKKRVDFLRPQNATYLLYHGVATTVPLSVLTTLYIYYIPVDCDLFRPCVYYTTGLPTINPIYLLYHRVTIWWHVHYTAGWQTFSWCIHLTTGVTRVSPLQNPCIYYTTGWQL